MAITSLAAVMSKRSSRTCPLAGPPLPMVMLRSARSFMSMTRGHEILDGSSLQALPCLR